MSSIEKSKASGGKKEGRGKKRPFEEDGAWDVRAENPTIGQQTSFIGNKLVRSERYAKLLHKKKKEKRAKRDSNQKAAAKAAELGLEGPPKKIPKTIENTREKDETIVVADDEEVKADDEQDEFASYFRHEQMPKVMLTTCYRPTKIMFQFLADLIEMLPNAVYYTRKGYPLKKIVQYATAREFTDIMVFNEDRKQINGLLLIHLPDGPTAHFKLSNLRLCKDIRNHGRPTNHKPELILNNFGTRLGHRMGRMLASLFPPAPQFRGRQAVTFHNQRDYIFVRHHRYVFEEKEKRVAGRKDKVKHVKPRLQELGPRFTLKLRSLQRGTFDSKTGEFEYLPKPDANTSRRRFFL